MPGTRENYIQPNTLNVYSEVSHIEVSGTYSKEGEHRISAFDTSMILTKDFSPSPSMLFMNHNTELDQNFNTNTQPFVNLNFWIF